MFLSLVHHVSVWRKTCISSTVELRMAVKKVICNDQKEREKYEEALLAIKMDDVPLPR